MSRTCAYTGKSTSAGNNVSHSVRRTTRQFRVNLFSKRITDPDTGKVYRLKLSAKAIKIMKKIGVTAFLNNLRKSREIV